MNGCLDSTQPGPHDSRHSGKHFGASGPPNPSGFTLRHQLCYNAPDQLITNMEVPYNSGAKLIPDFARQEERFSSAFSIVRHAIAQHSFPAASVAITQNASLIALKAFGNFVYQSDATGAPSLSRSLRQGGDFEVTSSTLFDLASLTKVLATTIMAAILYERGLLDLDAPISGTVPEFLDHSNAPPDPRRRNVTFSMLLAHSSGLPAYEKLFLRCPSRDQLLHAAFTTALTADPATRAEYSDIGFMILGVALERISEEPLDHFCQREIFGPLAMAHTTFNPPPNQRPNIPPTADEREQSSGESGADTPVPEHSTFRNRIIQGEVQDENAFVLGGVAGHAGLFSTAADLARFAHAMLQCGAGAPAREAPTAQLPILRPETIALFTQRQSEPPKTSRALGWDTPSAPSQSGKYFGPRSFGHLGYTGTSLWIDPDRQLSITLLTNRTWPDCGNQAIKQVRPRFHDAVIEALESL